MRNAKTPLCEPLHPIFISTATDCRPSNNYMTAIHNWIKLKKLIDVAMDLG
jgi:hypothetical protein